MRLARTLRGLARLEGDELAVLDLPHPDLAALFADDDLDLASAPVRGRLLAEDAVLLAPIIAPTRVVIIGLNYHAHATETGAEVPKVPRFAVAAGGPGIVSAWNDPIRLPTRAPSMVDYEGELGVVIGQAGREIRASEAWTHVGGLVVTNDVSARDVQRAAMSAGKPGLGGAKTFPSFKPCGGLLSTTDEFETDGSDLDLRLTTTVNGEQRQNGRTADLIFSIPEIIEVVSRTVVLEPGDLICTGTPGGVGAPSGTFLRSADIVEVSIAKLGTVTNEIEAS